MSVLLRMQEVISYWVRYIDWFFSSLAYKFMISVANLESHDFQLLLVLQLLVESIFRRLIPSGRRGCSTVVGRPIEVRLLLSLQPEQVFGHEALVFKHFVCTFVDAVVGVRRRPVRRPIWGRGGARFQETTARRLFAVVLAFLVTTLPTAHGRSFSRQRRVHRHPTVEVHNRWPRLCAPRRCRVIQDVVVVQPTAIVAWAASKRLCGRRWNGQHPVLAKCAVPAEHIVPTTVPRDFRVVAKVVVERLCFAVVFEVVIHTRLPIEVQHLVGFGLSAARKWVIAITQRLRAVFGRHVERRFAPHVDIVRLFAMPRQICRRLRGRSVADSHHQLLELRSIRRSLGKL